jgi:hypothetical protein
VRNLSTPITSLLKPKRFCTNSTGPRAVQLDQIAVSAINRPAKINSSEPSSLFSIQLVSLTESQNSRCCIQIVDSRKMWYLGLSSSGSGDRNGRRIE